jgi:NADH:ubiquinone oxidoreductase subunit 6 (subunit J)
MPTGLVFLIHVILGYVAWLLCFSVYMLPGLKSMSRFEAQWLIATIHSFRFFGLVFILPGFVGPKQKRRSSPRTETLPPEYWPCARQSAQS